jgi:hypothetical protein
MRPGPEVDALRALFTELLLEFDDVNSLIADRINTNSVRYERSAEHHPHVGTFASDVELRTSAGRTRLAVLMRAAKPVLLNGGDPSSVPAILERWGDRIVHVRTKDNAPLPRYVLVRPDGYIAWALDATFNDADTGPLCAALTTWFGEPDVPAAGTSTDAPGRQPAQREAELRTK